MKTTTPSIKSLACFLIFSSFTIFAQAHEYTLQLLGSSGTHEGAGLSTSVYAESRFDFTVAYSNPSEVEVDYIEVSVAFIAEEGYSDSYNSDFFTGEDINQSVWGLGVELDVPVTEQGDLQAEVLIFYTDGSYTIRWYGYDL